MSTKTRAKASPPSRQVLSRQLRAAIVERGLTAYALGRDAGVDAGVIQRFLNEERDIRLDTADRLADVLGLRLVEAARGRGRPSKPARPGRARMEVRREEPSPGEAMDGVGAAGPESIPDHSGPPEAIPGHEDSRPDIMGHPAPFPDDEGENR